MKKLIGILLLPFMMATTAQAASYAHQLEASLLLDQREFDPDGSGGSVDNDIFTIDLTYRHQYKSRVFFVGNLDFSNGGQDYIGFGGGLEYNLISNAADKIEAGGGFLFSLYTGDISGFGFRPYGFVRSFISGGFFITSQLSYDLAFVDINGTDGDITGIVISAGFGYAF